MRHTLLVFIFLISLQADNDYQLGKGMQAGSLPLYIGGYFSIDYQHTDEINRYRLSDLAILSYGNYEKLSYMAEVEFQDLYVKTYKNAHKKTTKSKKLHIERLNLDYNIDEKYMLKVGKYHSTVGFWNLLPVNVLRETTSNPISRDILFPIFTTGIDFSYLSYEDGELKIDIMMQHNKDISNRSNNYKIDRHYGIGISYEEGDYTFKINGGYFHTFDKNIVDENLYYLLLSAKYESDKYQVLSEIGSQKSKAEFTVDYAGYIQGLYRFTEQHLGVIRVESYRSNLNKPSDDMLIVGYTYRPLYPIAIKSEYQFHSKNRQNQFLFSMSVLF